jgi:hypothetical protein
MSINKWDEIIEVLDGVTILTDDPSPSDFFIRMFSMCGLCYYANYLADEKDINIPDPCVLCPLFKVNGEYGCIDWEPFEILRRHLTIVSPRQPGEDVWTDGKIYVAKEQSEFILKTLKKLKEVAHELVDKP